MNDTFSVSLWLSHPDNENDDCMTGEDFVSLDAARVCVANLSGTFNMTYFRDCAFIMIDGPGINEVTELPGVAKRAAKERASFYQQERSERRMQAGMLGGIDAYNDAD